MKLKIKNYNYNNQNKHIKYNQIYQKKKDLNILIELINYKNNQMIYKMLIMNLKKKNQNNKDY